MGLGEKGKKDEFQDQVFLPYSFEVKIENISYGRF